MYLLYLAERGNSLGTTVRRKCTTDRVGECGSSKETGLGSCRLANKSFAVGQFTTNPPHRQTLVIFIRRW